MSTQKLLSDSKKHRNFGVILYPDCPEHLNMLDYLLKHEYIFQCVYILHDKDDKKEHMHVLIHCKNPYTVSAFVKFFAVWIDYAEPISSASSYILYMLHDTPESMGKHQYSPEELKGDSKLIHSVIQKSHFVQLAEICDIMENGDGSMLSLVREVANNNRDEMLETVKTYQSLICTMSNQEFRRRQINESYRN